MQTPKKHKVQTVKPVTVSNKPKKKGPVAKMGELETRFRASMIKRAGAIDEVGIVVHKEYGDHPLFSTTAQAR